MSTDTDHVTLHPQILLTDDLLDRSDILNVAKDHHHISIVKKLMLQALQEPAQMA